MSKTANPLTKFYRTAALSVSLPSKGKYYDDGVVKLNDDGEVPVFPMTAQDEITLQNPDALLSGEAITNVIRSCVPDVSKPKKLLSCDIDVLMIGIRIASYGETATMDADCPKCNESNTFTMNLDSLLNQTETLENEYEIVLDNNLTIFVAPSRFENMVRQQKTAFQNTKLERAITDPSLSDEARLTILSQVFKQVSKFNFEAVHEAIQKIIFTEDGEENVITNQTHIGEWIKNIEKTSIDKIESKIIEVNRIGIEKSMGAACKHCEHKWEANIEFNPVNFS